MPTKGKAFIASPIAGVGGGVIASPFQFTTTGEDRLRVRVVNSEPNVVVHVNARIIDRVGVVTPASWTITPAFDRSVSESDFALSVGAVMNVTCFSSGGFPLIGQTYVQVFLTRGDGDAAFIVGQLLGGYCTHSQHVSWPGSPIRPSTDGDGAVRTFGGTLPAVGSDLVETVPDGARWELLCAAASLVTSATVGTRTPRLRYTSHGVDFIGFFPSLTSFPASTSGTFTWGQGLENSVDAVMKTITIPIPARTPLLAGQTFATQTEGRTAGDQWVAPIYTVREWLEVA